MSERTATTYNTILGIDAEGEIVILEDIFEYSADFKGATGSIIRPVYQDEIDAALTDEEIVDYHEEIWQLAVENGETRDGLEAWVDENIDGDEYINARFEEYQGIECDEIINALQDAGLWDPQDERRPVRFEVRGLGRIFPRAITEDFRWVPAARDNLLPLIAAAEARD